MSVNLDLAFEEFSRLKADNVKRNRDYYLLRQAVKGNFRWPVDWPNHIEKEVDNFCKPIVHRHTSLLMGKGFDWNLERPNTMEMRDAAERAEKILKVIQEKSKASLQFVDGAKNGTMLGRSVFKVFRRGQKGREIASFASIQPDYVYTVEAGGEALGEFATLYYSYPLDILEAKRIYGNRDYRTETEVTESHRYSVLPEDYREPAEHGRRRVPVLEVWTRDSFALVVGGIVIQNGENPNKWSDTNEGFIPFVVIENTRNGGDLLGEADIAQSRVLNEKLNWLQARKSHLVTRYCTPTLVWEGAPTNYADALRATVNGGGALPTRIGSRLSFLSYDTSNPTVAERQAELREAILRTSGLNEAALEGDFGGAIHTSSSMSAQLMPATGVVEEKRLAWGVGLAELFAMCLQVQESIGDSKALGEAVVNRDANATENMEAVPEDDLVADVNDGGILVELSGKDIAGLRRVTISWPGVLPKDDLDAARFELEKASQGYQSIYTTLEKLGVEQPADELARLRIENQDPSLRGDKVAEQIRAGTPLARQQAEQEFQMQQMAMQGGEGGGMPPGGGIPGVGGMGGMQQDPEMDLGGSLRERLRALSGGAGEFGEDEEGNPFIGFGG